MPARARRCARRAARPIARSTARDPRCVENQPNLSLFQQAVDDLVIEGDRVTGVRTQLGLRFRSRRSRGADRRHLPRRPHPRRATPVRGGRAGDPPAMRWPRAARGDLGVGRLKTGTPPRIDGRTIDYSRDAGAARRRSAPGVLLPRQPRRPSAPGAAAGSPTPPARTHEIIRGALDRSPLYSGQIEGVGPRYCPSIEDKVVRFADKDSHQIFVEPEGLDTHEIYPNGISTSLPFDVQVDLVRSIRGFERAHITRPATRSSTTSSTRAGCTHR
jgi:tRNA uridine 5-carboxymethylaminomethyl modification enzyme